MRKGMILLGALALLSFCLIGCLGIDDPDPSDPGGTVLIGEQAGTDRFSEEQVKDFGCPDSEKVPNWMVIPECE